MARSFPLSRQPQAGVFSCLRARTSETIWTTLRRVFLGRSVEDKAEEFLEHHLFTSLTVIRSSAELMRENPEISEAERQRFLDAMLKEEQRIERLLTRILRPS